MKPTFESIKKRDGRIVPFDHEKITQAIWEAAQAVGGKDRRRAEVLAGDVVRALGRSYEPGGVPGVEHVQDVVEKVLIEAGHARTAKAYILYREQHKNIREASRLLRDITIVDDYLEEMDWRVRENSNMTYSLQGLNVHITQKVISNYWLASIYPREVREAHESGAFHIHDLGTLGPYCVGWDLQDLLREGFRGVKGKVESRPARHFDVALMQVVNFLYTLQGEAAGAQAFSSFDTLLAPFVARDGLSYDEVRHCVQMFLYNMNVPTRVGFQTPFTNITMDLVPPPHLAGEPAIIGGEVEESTYGEFQREMDMINRAFAETMCGGDAGGRPFTFPIPTYNITPEFQWDNPNLEPLWEMTAKYGIPYFSNFINSDLKPDDVRSMCCRLRLDNRTLAKRGGGLFGANPLTGSIGVVTLNLPRYAFVASGDPDGFLEIVGAHMDVARASLTVKRKVLEKFTERGLYPYSMFYLRAVKEATGAYWRNHFSTIGIVGMNEALVNLIGKDIATGEGIALATRTLDFMRERLVAYQEDGGEIYNLEATPAEGTSYRLARIDAARNPGMLIFDKARYARSARSARNGRRPEVPYYTNSTQLPVGHTDDIFEALRLQDPLQARYTGGTVLHGFLGERLPSTVATRQLVRVIAESFHLPYFTLTPTFSVCPVHGYLAGEKPTCPTCGESCEVWSRSVGYLRPVEQWNEGKQEEFRDRKTFDRQLREARAAAPTGDTYSGPPARAAELALESAAEAELASPPEPAFARAAELARA